MSVTKDPGPGNFWPVSRRFAVSLVLVLLAITAVGGCALLQGLGGSRYTQGTATILEITGAMPGLTQPAAPLALDSGAYQDLLARAEFSSGDGWRIMLLNFSMDGSGGQLNIEAANGIVPGGWFATGAVHDGCVAQVVGDFAVEFAGTITCVHMLSGDTDVNASVSWSVHGS